MKRRSDGLYQISVVVEEHGRRKRKYFYGKTQQEAKRKMMAWKDNKSRGRSFADVANKWAERHREEVAAGTWTCYRPAVDRALDAFGDIPIRLITPVDIQRSIDRMAAQGYAHHSVTVYLSALRQIFRAAILDQDINDDPTIAIRIPKGLQTTRRECPSDDSLNIIRNNADAPFGMFAYMLLYTGLRRGELLALQWRDVDFGRQVIRVTKSVTYAETGNKPVVKPPKTSAGIREVVMLDRLAQRLWVLRGTPTEYVFGGAAPLTQSVYRKMWNQYCLSVGLWEWEQTDRMGGARKVAKLVKRPSVTPHQLRHAYATMCYELGVDAKDAQQLLGHSKVEVTLDTYTHIRQARRSAVADKLNKAE